jgi:hypothetical protein
MSGNRRQYTADFMAKVVLQGLMNPPFGAGNLQTKAMLTAAYPRTKNNVYAAFVERGLQLLEVGDNLGAVTSRTGFFLSSFQKWREEILPTAPCSLN